MKHDLQAELSFFSNEKELKLQCLLLGTQPVKGRDKNRRKKEREVDCLSLIIISVIAFMTTKYFSLCIYFLYTMQLVRQAIPPLRTRYKKKSKNFKLL
jgi:hypothetical protein